MADAMGDSKVSDTTNIDGANDNLDWTKSGYSGAQSVDRAVYQSRTVLNDDGKRSSDGMSQIKNSEMRKEGNTNIDASKITSLTKNLDMKGLGGITVATDYHEFKNYRRQLSRGSSIVKGQPDIDKNCDDIAMTYSRIAISSLNNKQDKDQINDDKIYDEWKIVQNRAIDEVPRYSDIKAKPTVDAKVPTVSLRGSFVNDKMASAPKNRHLQAATHPKSIDPIQRILNLVWEVVGLKTDQDEKNFLKMTSNTGIFVNELKWYMESIRKTRLILQKIKMPATLPQEHVFEWNKLASQVKLCLLPSGSLSELQKSSHNLSLGPSIEKNQASPSINQSNSGKANTIPVSEKDSSKIIMESIFELDKLSQNSRPNLKNIHLSSNFQMQEGYNTPGFVTAQPSSMQTFGNISRQTGVNDPRDQIGDYRDKALGFRPTHAFNFRDPGQG